MLNGLIMAFGMFSVIPVPKSTWSQKHMNLIMPFFPIVGCVIGLVWYWLAVLLMILKIPLIITAAVSTLIPFALSGFLHLDGFMDTSDAIMSRRSLEEKRRILKDSRLGAFAAVALVSMFLLNFASVYTVVSTNRVLPVFVFIPIVSRCVTGIAAISLKPISDSGYAASFKAGTTLWHLGALASIGVFSFAIAYFVWGAKIIIPLFGMTAAGIGAAFYSYRQLQGFSGDLCGYMLSISETAGLIIAAVIY